MSKIEKAAVGAVRCYVDSCPRLDSIINENDKTPFWDGKHSVNPVSTFKGNQRL